MIYELIIAIIYPQQVYEKCANFRHIISCLFTAGYSLVLATHTANWCCSQFISETISSDPALSPLRRTPWNTFETSRQHESRASCVCCYRCCCCFCCYYSLISSSSRSSSRKKPHTDKVQYVFVSLFFFCFFLATTTTWLQSYGCLLASPRRSGSIRFWAQYFAQRRQRRRDDGSANRFQVFLRGANATRAQSAGDKQQVHVLAANRESSTIK